MESNTGCPVGILIDLSEPDPVPARVENFHQEENKDNSAPETDAIEVTRKDSQEDCHWVDIDDGLKHDIAAKKMGQQPQSSESDIRLIEDEVFDFDLPLSPESGREGGGNKAASSVDNDEEEVFFGPMGFTEKCIAAGVEEEVIQPLTPLRPDQMAELAKEAYSVANRIALMNTSTTPVTVCQAKTLKLCHKNPSSVLTSSNYSEKHQSSTSSHTSDSAAHSETHSPKKRKHSEIVSNENTPESVPDKGRERSNTFTKEKPAEVVTSCVTMTWPANKERQSLGVGGKDLFPVPSQQGASRLQPPSKLRRYNNSQPNLSKTKAVEESAEELNGGEVGTKTTAPAPASKRSLQPPRAAGKGAVQECGDRGSSQNTAHSSRTGVRRAHSLTYKSGLPSGRGSKLALPSGRTLAAASSGQHAAGADSGGSEATLAAATASNSSARGSGIPKGPATKPQLMQPGQMQRKTFGLGRGMTSSAATAPVPLKAPPPPSDHAPTASKPHMMDTVERPYNPVLAVASAVVVGNVQCPYTPAPYRTLPPRVLSLSSEASTPAKSSCSSSSACGSTPASMNFRMSLLPTSTNRRSTAGSLPPPSPLSVGSSSSSVSKRSVASSDAADSPVFDPHMSSRLAKARCISAAKSRKTLVQNTPDLPKRKVSQWSPVRKPKAMPLEDQVSMCTKKITPP